MPKEKYASIKVGMFVLAALIIVIAALFWTKSYLYTSNMRDIKVKFESVTGLKAGDPVVVNGVRKGKVKNFDLVGDSVEVEFLLESEIRIKRDYKIEIISTELLGGKTLNIFIGRDPNEIDYSQILIGSKSSDITELVSSVTDMTGDIKVLISNFNKASVQLDTVLRSINDIVGDPNMKSDVKGTISNISETSKNLNALVSENKQTLKSIAEKTSFTIDKVGLTIDNVNGVIDNNKPEFAETIKNVKTLTVKINDLVSNLNNLVGDISQKKSGLGKFIYDDKFFDELNKTLEEIQLLTKKIRENGLKMDIF